MSFLSRYRGPVILACVLAAACSDPADPPEPASISIAPSTVSLAAFDDTAELTATVYDQNGQAMPGVVVTWTSDDGSVARVDGVGLVTAVANGSTKITAKSGSVEGSATAMVEQRVTEIRVSPVPDTLRAFGDTLRLAAEALDGNGYPIDGITFIWSSSDESVATVDANGLVTAVGNGRVEISVEAGSVDANATATVQQRIAAIQVSPMPDTLRALGDTVRFTARALDANSHVIGGVDFTWSSSDETVATVDQEGLVTAVGKGGAEISAEAGSVEAGATVTVEQRLTGIRVSPMRDTLWALGDTVRLTASGFDANGHLIEGVDFTWSSSDETVATVDRRGLVTAVGNGSTEIMAGAGSVDGAATATVRQRAYEIRISPIPDTWALRDTVRLVAELFDKNGHPITDVDFAWSSSDESVASVDHEGLVTTIGPGSAEITVEAVGHGLTEVVRIVIELTPRDILKALYDATDGDNWKNNDNWLTDAPLDSWYGLTLDNRERIIYMSLSANGLSGTIPRELGYLPDLETLSLASNDLYGTIPPDLGNLAKLRQLRLHWNSLSGGIPPELGNLEALTQLLLSGNLLVGSIPTELGKLRSLAQLAVTDNGLSGSIPPELGRLRNLRSLSLNKNALSGSIPPELGSLIYLGGMSLQDNYLSGSIPAELGLLPRLGYLNLSNNDLTGAIPPELGDLPNLTNLNFFRNDLTGTIPAELGSLAKIKFLSLNSNKLTGAIPASLGEMETLQYMELQHNELTGSVPPELGELANLIWLKLDNNRLSGKLPRELADLESLSLMKLNGNGGLTGPIPQQFVRIPLRSLYWKETDLCSPDNDDFQDWLDGLNYNVGEGKCGS